MSAHQEYLIAALALAEERRGFCAPNPAVGAIVVKNGHILGRGCHFAAGFNHAEVEALAEVGDEAQGATLYVTLAPCCHQGKTPPCTGLLIQRGIAKVFYGFADPHPLVGEQSQAVLAQAGIDSQLIVMDEITAFYQSYVHWIQTQTPWVRAKLALSLDGRIAGPRSEPIAITGDECAQYTHNQRKLSDAILTTARTIHADNPQLNVRLEGKVWQKPVYVLDRNLTLADNARIFKTSASLTLFHQLNVTQKRVDQLTAQGVRCIATPMLAEGLNLKTVINQIGQDGVHDLWVEAGGICFQALLNAGLVQAALLYVAPKCLGKKALPAFHAQQDPFRGAKTVQWQSLGRDALCQLRF